MEKLVEKQFLLIMNGPSCSGKTTVANIIWEKYGGIFNAHGDTLKWLISGYDPDVQREIVHELVIETVRVALQNGLSVIKQGALLGPKELTKMAEQFNVPMFIVNISAPKEVLEKRFHERVEAKKSGAKIANTSIDRFWELYDMYVANKMSTPLEFDSSLQAPEEIAEQIVEYIRKNIVYGRSI